MCVVVDGAQPVQLRRVRRCNAGVSSDAWGIVGGVKKEAGSNAGGLGCLMIDEI